MLLENSVLIDKANIVSAVWNTLTSQTLDISEVYLLTKGYATNNYCQGGDLTVALNQLQDMKTVELEANYPYSQSLKYEIMHNTSQEILPIIKAADYLLPFKQFDFANGKTF